jgi:signal transduction histidine kinase
MKNSRGWMIWGALALCAAMVLGAMGGLTRSVLAAEKERAEAEARADLEERTRLALWRMDAEGASVILAENRIPSRLYLSLEASRQPAEVAANDLATLRFRALPNGPLSCPFESASDPLGMEKLQRLRAILGNHPLPLEGGALLQCAALESEQSWQAIDKTGLAEKSQNLALRQNQGPVRARGGQEYQTGFNDAERAQRAKIVGQTVNNSNSFRQQDQVAAPSELVFGGQEPGEVGDMRAVWIADELFLLRQVSFPDPGSSGGQERAALSHLVQGVWMDSTKVRDRLLGEIRDLLPSASLTPLTAVNGISPASVEDPLALVSFPFRLERNELIQGEATLFGAPLMIGWVAVLCALAAVAVMVRGILRLSERRASFVSAVTHELRTPLTTFQLYSDMLQSGAVKEENRGEYFRTLHREAGRLSHLVENVLAFSGIEKGSARAAPATLQAGELIRPMLDRFAERLQEVGMRLACDPAAPAWQTAVQADRAAVEHVLFNLIDNAAKYAAGSSPAEVALEAQAGDRDFSILVRDHGPGIPLAERKRVFRAFHKSAAAAAESRPGVGLGLALSRRLARAGGGELELRPAGDGSCFALTLPLAAAGVHVRPGGGGGLPA